MPVQEPEEPNKLSAGEFEVWRDIAEMLVLEKASGRVVRGVHVG